MGLYRVSMGLYGAPLISMELYGVSMGHHRSLWGSIVSLWGTIDLYGVPMGSLWVSMGHHRSLWGLYGVSMGRYGVSMGLYRAP